MAQATADAVDRLCEMEIAEDPALTPMEKETTLTFSKDREYGRFHTANRTGIKWVLSIEEAEILDYRTNDGTLVAVTADIPRGIVKLQGSARKSNHMSQMVTYGDEL